MLRHGRHFEVIEDQDEYENVINAERVFDQVSSQKFETLIRSAHFPDQQVEEKRKGDPDHVAMERRAHAQRPVSLLELSKVRRDGDEDPNMKSDPKPDARRHEGASVSCQSTDRNRKQNARRLFSRAGRSSS
jgi:hypothetical protein